MYGEERISWRQSFLFADFLKQTILGSTIFSFLHMETPSHLPQKGLTIDIIISRFIPIIGVLLFTIGLGYLIYTSVWISLGVMEKLGLGFFLSLVISVGAFSFSDKLRYFADVVMG